MEMGKKKKKNRFWNIDIHLKSIFETNYVFD